jgi:hypothetical protein
MGEKTWSWMGRSLLITLTGLLSIGTTYVLAWLGRKWGLVAGMVLGALAPIIAWKIIEDDFTRTLVGGWGMEVMALCLTALITAPQ